MDVQSNCLFITNVEKEGPFLRVWGQTHKNTSLYIEQVLHSFTAQFDNGLCIPQPESLQIGILCCAKYKDNKYYRARITSLDYLHNRYIEVNFVDYGHKDLVPVSNIRSLEGFDTNFISIPPQAHSFLLAEAVCPGGEWNDAYFDEICKEIRYTEVNFSIIAQVTKHYLARLFVGVNDLLLILVAKGLVKQTSLTTQEAVLLSMMPRSPFQQLQQQQQPSAQQNIATYKAFTLEPGSQYEVYVSYVTDGPCNFSVQLKQSEEVLGKLMKEINSMTLTPIEGIPIPGTVCLARCLEDGHICRAVVTNEVDGQFKVFYVDFGNFEVIPLESIYEIPFKFVIPKVMAIRFALAGIEKSTVTLEMQCAFKEFVDNRLIHMKVMPMTTRSSLPRCDLWDPETGISALQVVTQAASAGYPDRITLNRGFSQPVKVSYVFSCNRFYVQLKSKQDELLRLMLDIQLACQDADPISANAIKVDLPCYTLYGGDQQWYRSQIVEVLPNDQVRVKYVDYGNEDTVPVSFLKPIEGKQLTILRPQAIECCLNGYQNMEPDLERDNLLEDLILEQEFTMKVVEMQGKKALIELIDASNYNVASLLLDKIAMTRSQVSPMLVQAGNKIEHRKSSSQFNPRDLPPKQDQRKPERAQRQFGESTGEKLGWRKDARGPRNKNINETNDSNEEGTSWRQNNKGFHNRNNNHDDLNESTDSEKRSVKGVHNNDENRNDFNSRNNEDGQGRQNRGFNKSQGRFNRNVNRNDEWGGSKSDKKDEHYDQNQNDWSKNVDNNRRIAEGQDDRGSNNERQNFRSKDRNDWGGSRDSGKPNFKTRDKQEWSASKDSSKFPNRKGRVDWNNRENDKRNFNDWSSSESRQENDNWGGSRDERKGRDNFKKRERFNEKIDDWGKTDTPNKSEFRKKSDFRREKSELSSSGSEKSFRKGGFNKNKPSFNKKPDRSPKSALGDIGGGDDSCGVSSTASAEVPNAAPFTAKFNLQTVDNTESNVSISWFHNPAYFYCQLTHNQEKFKQMMEDIQQAYKNRPPSTAQVGAPIIGLFPEDGVLYRAEILEIVGSQFKVYYVDFGNVSVIDKVWPIEMTFMELPAQAISCKLANVSPPSETWPDASSYSQYFDKNIFFCKFLSTVNEKVSVILECDGEDIASLLLRDGMAKTTTLALPPELPLLIGQQFKAMLISVNSLGDFSVSLQSGFLLNCAIHNLSASKETGENILKEKVGQLLIVYVDDLKDEILQVTLYDQSGQKMMLIDSDDGAYETVELMCPYLIQYSVLSGKITHVENDTIYIQPSDCASTVEYLDNAMFEYYNNITLENPLTPVEEYVYAIKSSDSCWYRGRIIKLNDGQVTVNYIDYGHSEDVNVDALRELIVEFMELQIMCIPVVIENTSGDLKNKCVNVNIRFTDAGLEGTIQEEQETKAIAIPVPVESPEVAPTETVEPTVQPTESTGTLVILSHVDSPSDFYLQLAKSIDDIEQLQATLQEQIVDMPDMENPVIGVLCAAPYSLDQQWYRAQVLDADTDITTVRFVDYGNTDVLDNQTTKVKTLLPHLLALEVHATRCRLKLKPIDDEWTTTASERFEQLCNVEALTVQFISQDEKTNYVELFSNGQNIGEILIKENLAQPDNVSETSSIGFVSHLNSPSEFWIQLESCVDELEWIAEQLSGAESFPELEDLAPGTLCAALFPDDQMWYRARILSNTVAGIEVVFVDYGNSCTSCSLRELPEDLVMLPPLAQKCSIQKPENLTTWGPEMIRKFAEIAADGQTTFTVKKLSTGETAAVILYLDGVDVTALILPHTDEIRVKNSQNLDELVLIKGEEELPNKYKLEPLPDIAWTGDSIKKFEELNGNGKTVFQAEFVSDDTVRLYLGLNDIRLELSGVKTTTPTSSPMKMRPDKLDANIIHSNENIPGDDVKIIVESVVGASLTLCDIKTVVEGVEDTNIAHHNHSNYEDNIKFDIQRSSIDNVNKDETSNLFVISLLTEIIDKSVGVGVIKSVVSDMLEESSKEPELVGKLIINEIIDSAIAYSDEYIDRHFNISESIISDSPAEFKLTNTESYASESADLHPALPCNNSPINIASQIETFDNDTSSHNTHCIASQDSNQVIACNNTVADYTSCKDLVRPPQSSDNQNFRQEQNQVLICDDSFSNTSEGFVDSQICDDRDISEQDPIQVASFSTHPIDNYNPDTNTLDQCDNRHASSRDNFINDSIEDMNDSVGEGSANSNEHLIVNNILDAIIAQVFPSNQQSEINDNFITEVSTDDHSNQKNTEPEDTVPIESEASNEVKQSSDNSSKDINQVENKIEVELTDKKSDKSQEVISSKDSDLVCEEAISDVVKSLDQESKCNKSATDFSQNSISSKDLNLSLLKDVSNTDQVLDTEQLQENKKTESAKITPESDISLNIEKSPDKKDKSQDNANCDSGDHSVIESVEKIGTDTEEEQKSS